MPKELVPVERLTDGVSQQPDSRVFRTQAKSIINAWLSVVEGMDRRPGSEHIANLSNIAGGLDTNYFVHWIDIKPEFSDLDPATGNPIVVNAAQQYVLVGEKPQSGGTKMLRAFDLAGTELHIEDRAGTVAAGTLAATKPVWETEYLTGLTQSAHENLRFLTIADTTFIVNRTKVPTMNPTFKTNKPANGIGYFFVRLGAYLTDYNATIKYDSGGSPTLSFAETSTTWPGSQQGAAGYDPNIPPPSGQILNISTVAVALDLATKLSANPSKPAGMSISAVGPLVRVLGAAAPGDIVALIGTDGAGNTAMETLFETVDTTVDLPLYGIDDGFKLKVTGDPTIGGDDYYIKFVQDPLGNGAGLVGEGVWEQTIAHDTPYLIKPETMPHKLTRKVGTGAALPSGYTPASGEIYFDYEKIAWGERLTGDATINPDPSFIGRTISDVFLYKNRLGFLTDDRVVMSQVNQFFNFFRTDMTQLLDDDPIDVANGHTETVFTDRAIPFENDIMFFSDRGQFRIPGDEVLTPDTIGVRSIASYQNDTDVAPVLSGTGLFFAQKNGPFTQVLELFRRGDSGLFAASELSQVTRRYIPGQIREMTAARDANVLACVIDNPLAFNQKDVYIYQWHWSGNSKIQSAWHKWDFQDGAVHSAHFFEDKLYMLVFRANHVALERVDASEGGTDAFPAAAPTRSMDFTVRLDRKYVVPSGDPNVVFAGGNSTVTLKYDISPTELPVLQYFTDEATISHTVLLPSSVSRATPGSMTLTFNGVDLTSKDFWLGIPYLTTYEFPSILRKKSVTKQGGPGETVTAKGPSQVMEGTIVFDGAGPFYVEVTPKGQTAYKYWWNGGVLWIQTPNPSDPAVGGPSPKPTVQSGEFDFPVWAEARDVTIKIKSVYPYPCPIQRAEFYINHYHTGRSLT